MSVQLRNRAAPIRREVVLIFVALLLAACVPAANSSAPRNAGGATGGSAPLASYPGIQAVGIDTIPQDTPAELGSFLDNQYLTDAPLLWTIDTDGALVARYQMAMLDATVGIDRHGAIAFRNAVPADEAKSASQLAALAKA